MPVGGLPGWQNAKTRTKIGKAGTSFSLRTTSDEAATGAWPWEATTI